MDQSPVTNSSHVIIVYDATRDRGVHELRRTIDEVRLRGDILRRGDTLIILGVLHKVPNPMGYMKACPESFGGASIKAMEEEVLKKIDVYIKMLLRSAQVCEDEGVSIEVRITAGSPMKHVIIQEVVSYKAACVVLDRHLRRDLKYYLKQIPCKVALIQDNLSVVLKRPHATDETDPIEVVRSIYSMSKSVPPLTSLKAFTDNEGQFSSTVSYKTNLFSSTSYDISDTPKSTNSSWFPSLDFGHFSKPYPSGTPNIKAENEYCSSNQIPSKNYKSASRWESTEAPILCSSCGARTELYIKDSMQFSFSEIQIATQNFSKDNLLGEGGYGHVYKGELKDGQLIAAKVHKEASTQGFTEFQSEVYVLNFARHKNIVMLLGYCCKENLNILVYEYICNQSLDWHLFDTEANTLDWHQRYSIAIGIAKGLRFLHEECRGGPIIHRDVRPGNILLTHDFVPMLGDFGLARWKTTDEVQTRILGTFGYLAPEYAESGLVSVRTDVYAYGIILLQLLSGQKVVNSKREEGQQSLRQWAEPLIENLALHELIDQRIRDSYDTYELYLVAKAAYLCVQRSPEMRPSIGEVIGLLEGENNHLRDHVLPHYTTSST
ncbi:probable serine/threonine-protein kinase PBL24 isoform X2 [Mercurialis annua]|uniref:probable serine/threonine-protein kinase PBL24 isoform X2 n=1 Tax=Mercurialis annua TaxID=3986 RepID=UPI00215E3D39|nr:probable serine/threonine-protein kinase PBL24 isoform X2 [Mercurialis annua]